jgi:hypothetical protein
MGICALRQKPIPKDGKKFQLRQVPSMLYSRTKIEWSTQNERYERWGWKKVIFPDGNMDQVEIYSTLGFINDRRLCVLRNLLFVRPENLYTSPGSERLPLPSLIQDPTLPPGPVRNFFVHKIDQLAIKTFEMSETYCDDDFCFLRHISQKRKLSASDQCPICLVDNICKNQNVVFMVPCGHMLCLSCANEIPEQFFSVCYFCRTPIEREIEMENNCCSCFKLSEGTTNEILHETKCFSEAYMRRI